VGCPARGHTELFVASMVLLVVGVLLWKWYIDQIAVLFFGLGIVLGLAGGLGPSHIARTFVAGAKDMVGVVFIIACARALLVIAQDAKVLDTILYGASASSRCCRSAHRPGDVPDPVRDQLLPASGTAQAALTMPIMAPLADLVGITARRRSTRSSCASSSTRSCRPAP